MMINNFLKWWYTNKDGIEYMTLMGCSINDLLVISIIGILCGLIVLQYGDIAIHNYKISRKYKNSNTKNYLMYFTYVFIGCLMVGYGYRILSIWVNPYKFLILLLLLLNFVTGNFRKYMRRTNAVENLYKAEIELTAKYEMVMSETEKLITRSFSSKDTTMISYEDLKSLEEGVWYNANAGVKYMAVDLIGPILEFKTIIEPGWYFGGQKHDCFEKCVVRKGSLKKTPKGRDYLVGEEVLFDENEPHNPGSEEYTDINVYFSKEPF